MRGLKTMNKSNLKDKTIGMFNGFHCPKMGTIKDISVCITHQTRQPEDCKGCVYTSGEMPAPLTKGKEVKK